MVLVEELVTIFTFRDFTKEALKLHWILAKRWAQSVFHFVVLFIFVSQAAGLGLKTRVMAG